MGSVKNTTVLPDLEIHQIGPIQSLIWILAPEDNKLRYFWKPKFDDRNQLLEDLGI